MQRGNTEVNVGLRIARKEPYYGYAAADQYFHNGNEYPHLEPNLQLGL